MDNLPNRRSAKTDSQAVRPSDIFQGMETRTWTLNREKMIRGWETAGRPEGDPQEPWWISAVIRAKELGIDPKYIPFMSRDERFALNFGLLRLPENNQDNTNNHPF
jgi:hypothetical protein